MNKVLIELTTAINFKSVMSILGSLLAYFTGGHLLAFTVLLVLTFVDGCTGIYKAWYSGEITSVRFRDKVKHYIAYCIVIISMNQVLLITPYVQFLADFIVLYFATGELISIMENLEEAGIPMPTYVKKKLMGISKRKKQREARYKN